MEKNVSASVNDFRKPYQKPLIQRVNLVPQEAVLAGCKATYVASGVLGLQLCDYLGDQCDALGS